MCTLSVLITEDGPIVAMNRDERRSRPAGGPVRRGWAGPVDFAHPTDVEAGGTWFAATGAGLVFALLNHYPAERGLGARPKSRGALIPALLGAGDIAEALAGILGVDPTQYGPFRLYLLSAGEAALATVTSDGAALSTRRRPLQTALFVSSGWNEPAVRAWREARWGRFLHGELRGEPRPIEALRRLHFTPSETDGAFGFSMARPEAMSRSYSEAARAPGGWIFRHLEAPPVGLDAAKRRALEASAQRVGG